jgi:hypothetical protein
MYLQVSTCQDVLNITAGVPGCVVHRVQEIRNPRGATTAPRGPKHGPDARHVNAACRKALHCLLWSARKEVGSTTCLPSGTSVIIQGGGSSTMSRKRLAVLLAGMFAKMAPRRI